MGLKFEWQIRFVKAHVDGWMLLWLSSRNQCQMFVCLYIIKMGLIAFWTEWILTRKEFVLHQLRWVSMLFGKHPWYCKHSIQLEIYHSHSPSRSLVRSFVSRLMRVRNQFRIHDMFSGAKWMQINFFLPHWIFPCVRHDKRKEKKNFHFGFILHSSFQSSPWNNEMKNFPLILSLSFSRLSYQRHSFCEHVVY